MMQLHFIQASLFLLYQQCSLMRVKGNCPTNNENDPEWRYAVFERKAKGRLSVINLIIFSLTYSRPSNVLSFLTFFNMTCTVGVLLAVHKLSVSQVHIGLLRKCRLRRTESKRNQSLLIFLKCIGQQL